jgi:hypothetical protein
MSVPRNICPVPFDQQPLNEFYVLKNSCFFSFFGFNLRKYIYRILTICCISICLFAPLIRISISFSWNVFILDEVFCVILCLSAILVRLYLGWSYIVSRLFSATIFYEESGWYDGQIWIKTPEMLTKDRLIATYYVLPLLQRIKLTLISLSLFLFVELCSYSLLC